MATPWASRLPFLYALKGRSQTCPLTHFLHVSKSKHWPHTGRWSIKETPGAAAAPANAPPAYPLNFAVSPMQRVPRTFRLLLRRRPVSLLAALALLAIVLHPAIHAHGPSLLKTSGWETADTCTLCQHSPVPTIDEAADVPDLSRPDHASRLPTTDIPALTSFSFALFSRPPPAFNS